MDIKIYGERNTGTIYLEWLINQNVKEDLLHNYELGWKHRLAPEEDELTDDAKRNVLFLILIKNPYSWLISMHKRPFPHDILKDLNFSQFINFSFGDYKNPIVMWNKKYRSYLKLNEYVENHHMMRYEDLLSQPKETIMELVEKFNLPTESIFRNMNNSISSAKGISTRKFHKDYYIDEKWRKKVSPYHIKFINEQLDNELMELFNYETL